MNALDELLKIMDTLRDPEHGCPWDCQQTDATILPYTIEEVYELAEAIQAGDYDAMRDELGDLLFQIVFYSRMASERGDFDFIRVVEGIRDKLIRRHPHVFANENYNNADDQAAAWESIKAGERREQGREPEGLLDTVSTALPALLTARKLQKRAASVGFDWDSPAPVMDKLEEELAELREAMQTPENPAAITEEVGDLLFACVNLARHLGVEPETALMAANRKFRQRFAYIEQQLGARGVSPSEATLDEMEALWIQAKKLAPESNG